MLFIFSLIPWPFIFSYSMLYLFLVLISVTRPCNVPGMLRRDISRRFIIIIIIIIKCGLARSSPTCIFVSLWGGANDLKGLSCKPPFLYQKCRASQEVSACTELGGGVDDNREARGGEHVTRNERHANQRELET